MSFKKNNAEVSTITRDLCALEQETGNTYQTIAIIAKRANQLSVEMKEELSSKLQEFASHTDNLEEVFENREQIEISRYYEKLPKTSITALNEFLNDETYFKDKE